MKALETNLRLLSLFSLLVCSVYEVYALDYDHSYTPECLANPLKPQYGGGLVVKKKADHGNKLIVAHNQNGSHDSLLQKFNLEKQNFYIFSAWLQVSHGDQANVAAVFKTRTDSHHAGWSIARSGCWSMFKGGFFVNVSGLQSFSSSDHASADLWADSISLQPFTQEDWKSHQDQSIEKIRKSNVKIRAADSKGQPLANASIFIKQLAGAFPLGNAMSKNILTDPSYQNWFAARFRYTVFENEIKWYVNQPVNGREDYSLADGMLEFIQQLGIKARGHNVVWENPHWLPSWATSLSPTDFSAATARRAYSIMRRYEGQFIHWDVVNENLHFSFLETMLGKYASTLFYRRANFIDSTAIPFLNEFGTIEDEFDRFASPTMYLEKINDIRFQGYLGPLGIGLQGHFNTPNLAYVRAALDTLAAAKLPIWITELDVPGHRFQALYLEETIRELHSHPAVEGIMIWSPWSPPLCYRMCLTDGNFNNLPTGAVVDRILYELSHQGLVGITDTNGYFETSLFHGDYEVKMNHPAVANSSKAYIFKVDSSMQAQAHKTRQVQLFS